MISLLLAASLVVGAPFKDTQGRFTVEVPKGWKFTPLPGNTSGATFSRKLDGLPAAMNIRILKIQEELDLESFVKQLELGVSGEPGYKVLEEKAATLAKLPAIERRYVVLINGDEKWPKMVLQRIAVAGNQGFVVHAETMAEIFGTFEGEFVRFLDTFKPKGVDYSKVGKSSGKILVGRWEMVGAEETIFQINRDGTFDLGGAKGRFKVRGSKLITRPRGGKEESFTWVVKGRELILSGAGLEEPMRYRRALEKHASLRNPLFGTWEGAGHRLTITAGGTVQLNSRGGTYQVQHDMLIIRLGVKEKRVVLHYGVLGDELSVSGGPFGKESKLSRVR